MGYDAPDGFSDPDVAAPGNARDGGGFLAADVNGLWVTHSPDVQQHVTVIGHSYGSTTVADAFAQSGMHANDAVLLGCPGTDLARSAADFHLDGGQVYVGSASSDPVSWIGAAPEWLPDWLNRDAWLSGRARRGPGHRSGWRRIRLDPLRRGGGGLRRPGHQRPFALLRQGQRILARHDAHRHRHQRSARSGGSAGGGPAPAARAAPADRDRSAVPPPIPLPPVGADIPGSPAIIDTEARRPRQTITNDHSF